MDGKLSSELIFIYSIEYSDSDSDILREYYHRGYEKREKYWEWPRFPRSPLRKVPGETSSPPDNLLDVGLSGLRGREDPNVPAGDGGGE